MDMKVKEELKRGLHAAQQLRVLIAESRLKEEEQIRNYEELMACMSHQSSVILNAFGTAISILRSNNGHFKDADGSKCKGSSNSNKVLNCKRSCYNRRTSQPQPVKAINKDHLSDDGYSWRKYGQKPIINAKYPREYYRCGYKEQGCQATKHVQIIAENPIKYNIIYYGQHTCQHLPNNVFQSDLLDFSETVSFSANMLSFEISNAKHDLNTVQQGHTISHAEKPSRPHDHWCPKPSVSPDRSWPSIVPDLMGMDSVFSPHRVEVDYSYYEMAEFADELDGELQEFQLWE